MPNYFIPTFEAAFFDQEIVSKKASPLSEKWSLRHSKQNAPGMPIWGCRSQTCGQEIPKKGFREAIEQQGTNSPGER